MAGICGSELKQCFWHSTDWFREEFNFPVATASTEAYEKHQF